MPFVKGKSGNPRGRPPTGLALAEKIRETIDPKEMAEIAVAFLRDERNHVRDRISMWNALAERGWVKPPQQHEVVVAPMPTFDYDALSTDELRTLERLISKVPLLPSGDD
jgi:hypothetical protein